MYSLIKSSFIDKNVDDIVDFAMDGAEAVRSVEVALKFGVRYRLIFTDISMPIMDGLEAASIICNLHRK